MKPAPLLLAIVAAGTLGLPARAPGQQLTLETLDVFLDCQGLFCDFDHFRREIAFVNWARDRRDAHVHVLATSQLTGGGGREFTFAFIGLREFAGRLDTLRYVSRNTDTQNEIRDGQVLTLKLGLMRYVAQTHARERLTISYQAPSAAAPVGPVDDPWDYWVFRTSVGGSVDGESRQQAASVNGSFSASRITEALKITLRTSGRYSRSEYELDSVTTYVNTQRNLNADGLVVLSLGQHWSAGIRTSARSSTRLNQDFALEGGPALEYDLFPYRESTRRQLTFSYAAGAAGFDYEQETIFDKTSEVLPRHRLEVSLEVRQPWGSVNTSLEATQYLHDLARHQVNLFAGMQLRLFRGLQLNLFGSLGRIKDQLYLSKAGVSEEEILVQRRQLGTDYRYDANVSFSYTFGSRFNNVVNPRMGGGGGFFFFF
ncbi:MAG: hypothetical protein HYW06_12530 [Gemmatimonadetes bacterium]|nr:hypothetical protein [Gemmatimonadota bacterium]MBI2537761.1 hypothetical protein [Gemmatimonadota bacterium]